MNSNLVLTVWICHHKIFGNKIVLSALLYQRYIQCACICDFRYTLCNRYLSRAIFGAGSGVIGLRIPPSLAATALDRVACTGSFGVVGHMYICCMLAFSFTCLSQNIEGHIYISSIIWYTSLSLFSLHAHSHTHTHMYMYLTETYTCVHIQI